LRARYSRNRSNRTNGSRRAYLALWTRNGRSRTLRSGRACRTCSTCGTGGCGAGDLDLVRGATRLDRDVVSGLDRVENLCGYRLIEVLDVIDCVSVVRCSELLLELGENPRRQVAVIISEYDFVYH